MRRKGEPYRNGEIACKGDRALELLEKGVSTNAIKERLGFNSIHAVGAQILKARARRARAAEVAE